MTMNSNSFTLNLLINVSSRCFFQELINFTLNNKTTGGYCKISYDEH